MVRDHNHHDGGKSSGRAPLSPSLVVRTAAQLADRDGIGRLSLTRVAEKLEVSQPALYKHVRDAQDLLRLLALEARVQLLKRLRDATVGRSGDEAIVAVAHAWRGFVHEHPGLYSATDRHPLAGYEELEAATSDLVALIGRLVVGYGLAAEDVGHAAWSVRAALHGFVSLESEEGHPSAMDLDESFQRMVTLLCSGLRSMAARALPSAASEGSGGEAG